MNRCWVSFLSACIFAILSPAVFAYDTGFTGNSQPVNDNQPSLALNHYIRIQGDFANIGEVILFGGNFTPAGYVPCDGQLLLINQNDDLFAKIGTFYGGNGVSTFALPDLRGRTALHKGQGPGLMSRAIGEELGADEVQLLESQMPAHDHTLPQGGNTSETGGNGAFSNMQPSLVMNYATPLQGNWPYPDPGTANTPFLGQVRLFGGTQLPAGHVALDGQVAPVNGNADLFSVFGTTYGGDGVATFDLPDLRGRGAIHEGAGPGLTPRTLGQNVGAEDVMLTAGQLPAHDHTLPPSPDVTGATGGGQPFDNVQPSLTLNYIIATDGVFPSRSNDLGNTTFLGKISLFAGTVAPDGWAFCDGQILPVAQNTDLFSILGTTFGGNGQSTFALPDLRGRLAVGTGDAPDVESRVAGEVYGTEATVLTVDQLPRHNHDYVPEPGTLWMALGAVSLVGARLRHQLR